MKEIKAIIQPFRLEAVLNALHQIPGLPAMTVSPVHGIAVERGSYEQVAKTKLELMVADDQVEPVVCAIQHAAHTGNPGDGRIFVIPIEQTVKIRTGERDIGGSFSA
jgi:nitrogen regulatory protein PII